MVTISGGDLVSLALVTSTQFPSWFFQVSPFPSGFASSLKVCLPEEVAALLWMDPQFVVVYFHQELKPEIPFLKCHSCLNLLPSGPSLSVINLPGCDQD